MNADAMRMYKRMSRQMEIRDTMIKKQIEVIENTITGFQALANHKDATDSIKADVNDAIDYIKEELAACMPKKN